MLRICTTEIHCGGGTLRVVNADQLPSIPGGTLLEKRKYFQENLDHIRKFLLLEPRGHADLYGIVVVKVTDPEVDAGLILLHNDGHGSMCGHGTLAIARYMVDTGIIRAPVSPETEMRLQCPCGPVRAFVEYNNGKTGRARFISVPSYIFARDVTTTVPGYGELTADICFGGAFFVHVKASSIGLDVHKTPMKDLIEAGDAITRAYKACVTITHPESDDLAVLMGTNLLDDNEEYSDQDTALICVFADKQVERSPCGSGTTARIAELHMRGHLKLGVSRRIVGPTGDHFVARAIRELPFGPYEAVEVEVCGRAFYTGTSTLTMEEGDEIGRGFHLH